MESLELHESQSIEMRFRRLNDGSRMSLSFESVANLKIETESEIDAEDWGLFLQIDTAAEYEERAVLEVHTGIVSLWFSSDRVVYTELS